MGRGRKFFRAAGLSVATAVAVAGVLVPASPASARPHDCSLSVRLSPDPGSMYARADVNCANTERYAVQIIIRREDGWQGNSNVAEAYAGRNRKGYDWLSTSEPCSDVQTNKKYHAHAYLYDTRAGYPIEVKDVKSSSITGHC
ncbi:hypothetical protein [Streptosporangium sp. NBC_01469]|uniref:hypothetical protein n=1 Tax=Streptosporangium sp. NBC_01469 TaxID=2903898 RepID=UPI002E2AE5F2|nr:hypothetical protein [Streptosporangium sp. NBC_01469]